MENVSETVQSESIRSLQSTIRKMEKGLDQMKGKGSNTTLIEKRLHTIKVGLTILESFWSGQPHTQSRDDKVQTLDVLTGLMPSIQTAFVQAKAGSPQQTLLERRLTALEFAVQAVDDSLEER